MGYKDIIIAEGTIPANAQSYQSTLSVNVLNNYPGITADHVLLNDTLPIEITQDTTWTTYSKRLELTFADSIHFDNAVTATYVLGIPDN